MLTVYIGFIIGFFSNTIHYFKFFNDNDILGKDSKILTIKDLIYQYKNSIKHFNLMVYPPIILGELYSIDDPLFYKIFNR